MSYENILEMQKTRREQENGRLKRKLWGLHLGDRFNRHAAGIRLQGVHEKGWEEGSRPGSVLRALARAVTRPNAS
jgi:hypothetical protein